MPLPETMDIQEYFATWIEEYFDALDNDEKIQWIEEHMKSDATLRTFAEGYMDDVMDTESIFFVAVMNTVDWQDMYDWADDNLKAPLTDECEGCHKMKYTVHMLERECCNYVCAGCVNKHDENCRDYEPKDTAQACH